MVSRRLIMGVAVSAAMLAACGGGGSDDDSGSAQIRLVNASSAYSTLDLTVSDASAATGVAYGGVSAYASAKAGESITTLVKNAGTTISSLYPTLTKGSHYSLIAYGWSGNMKSTILQEEEVAPAENYSKLLVLNLAADAGTLDVYLTQNTDSLDNASPTISAITGGGSSGYTSISSGTYRVRVTGAGKKSDLRLDIPSITLSSKQVGSLVITPTPGGVLVNSILMTQQGSVAAHGATNARARVVAAVAGNAQVSATLGNTALMNASFAPNIGDYQIVAAGSPNLLVNVNGQTMPVTAPALTAGNDYTVLVWGEAVAPKISILNDDNRLPTTSGTAKLRLINGVASLSGGLTMTLDYSAVATDVQAGSASSAVSVLSSTSSTLEVFSPTVGAPVLSQTNFPIVSGGVYTVFMMGNANAIVGRPRRER
ncbi:DUF4397 domain-containing protein [Paucibacter sp. XJ19-41]|uniref:DUF4397 domain-containing protein n=1 Tax=Paucibacter sp. XJ19-41 TaxID=2927824 RepID=UPI00234AD679|nr:DUF4397 domain-containing protein [Paucibacter sp. XJ19-41]MDC6169594.1 DUF4397 domain-containing protein [Paucibacter sp. XJ19-41]